MITKKAGAVGNLLCIPTLPQWRHHKRSTALASKFAQLLQALLHKFPALQQFCLLGFKGHKTVGSCGKSLWISGKQLWIGKGGLQGLLRCPGNGLS